MKIFLSYNRDELLIGNEMQQNDIVNLMLNKIKSDDQNQYYFDDLKNEGFTDAQIFINIQNFINNDGCVFLFIGDSLVCYGWAERELRYALLKNREIRKIKIKKFIKLLQNEAVGMYKIYKKSKKIKLAI